MPMPLPMCAPSGLIVPTCRRPSAPPELPACLPLMPVLPLHSPLAPPAHLAVTSKLFEPLWITDLDRVSRLQVQLMDGPYTPRTRRTGTTPQSSLPTSPHMAQGSPLPAPVVGCLC